MDLFSTPTPSSSSSDSESKVKWIKLGNKDPFNNSTLEPGKLYDAKSKEQIEPFIAVILKATRTRKLTGKKEGKFHDFCGSFDGLVPAPKFANPFCRETNASQIAAVLKERGLKDVVISKAVDEVCKDGVLNQCCSYNSKTGAMYPQCSKAQKDPISGQPGPCKSKLRILGYNCSTQQLFQIEVGGSHEKEGTSFSNFIKHIQQSGVAKQYTQVVLGGLVEPSGFAQLEFSEPTLIVDELQRQEMDNKLQEIEEYYKSVSEWKPEDKTEESENLSRLEAQRAEDNIPF